jgi:2,4-dienoyl-CoA reductase-like NADH-dependent reductase (Old Yellow Enzyme family)
MTQLHQPITIKSVTFRNRLGMPPMCQYSAVDGLANDWHQIHYATRAVGGCGLIIVEATAVVPEGRITPFDLGIWADKQVEALQQVAALIHQNGAVAGIQIAHAGRKASHNAPDKGGNQLGIHEGGWETVAPSAIPFDPSEVAPTALDKKGINNIVDHFKAAALRAKHAGFKVLEIHAAHGYLIHEFLSPLTNLRTDEYGVSFENRARLLLEIVQAVNTVWPEDLPLLVRLSATDWVDGGWSPEETVQLCGILKNLGVDMIDCSSGGNIANAKIPVAPGFQIQFSEVIRSTGIKTATVGLITTKEQIDEIFEKDQADMVLLGRELLRNPYFPILATTNSSTELKWPVQYLRAK